MRGACACLTQQSYCPRSCILKMDLQFLKIAGQVYTAAQWRCHRGTLVPRTQLSRVVSFSFASFNLLPNRPSAGQVLWFPVLIPAWPEPDQERLPYVATISETSCTALCNCCYTCSCIGVRVICSVQVNMPCQFVKSEMDLRITQWSGRYLHMDHMAHGLSCSVGKLLTSGSKQASSTWFCCRWLFGWPFF